MDHDVPELSKHLGYRLRQKTCCDARDRTHLGRGGLRRVVGHLKGHVQRHQTGLKPSQIGGQSKYTAIPERDHIVADTRVRSSPLSNPNNRLIY